MKISNVILEELGDSYFALLVDESRNVSTKEQMVIVLHYVDKRGRVVDWFFGFIYITYANALTLLAQIEAMRAKHRLSLSNLLEQGHDGASNMRGDLTDLKRLY